MKNISILALWLLIIGYFDSYGQGETTKYGLDPIASLNAYQTLCLQDSNNRLVALDTFIPDLKLDIKYASLDNFMGRKMYNRAAAYLRLPAAKALRAVQMELMECGLGLQIFDAYRPYAVTVAFYEKAQDTVFVASPWKGSRHNRGCAVDLTLIDLHSGKELEMPTAFDAFVAEAHADYPHLPEAVIKNRELLKKVMTKYGFEVYPDEWWHFDFKDWKRFELLNISFEVLE
ncbi:M15 family metallopeptidase [Olivibacter sp. XZL3]|uniref:M15 family metallopeptidase n=1 Tax=Olivibacter sp. XZL3 TaxID=1735116 RepID=UPI001065F30A|nr:M15 family metallopeptidase [Olivibacter sp. XZL3]